ncbi:MAG TPA: SprT family zinc-dependent metalloprotease [Candidatus Sulfotelmatobacter sp.]|nr:SprT family zinc-dependent metalloprotease [Candidatus Sulfotelmatobacter sp.]
MSVGIDGRDVPVRLRRSRQARSMSIRLDPQDGVVLLVLPDFVSIAQGMVFVCSKADWLRQRMEALPPSRPFHPGGSIPYLGSEHRLVHRPDARRGVWREDGAIFVSGGEAYFQRRLTDWLKAGALAEITRRAQPMAQCLQSELGGRALGRVTLRDTRSRWGSCSSRGDLSFSWRLILTPPDVLNYVVAHEAAHLVEMNHSPAFWRIVEKLAPGARLFRVWLKRHGAELHRIG